MSFLAYLKNVCSYEDLVGFWNVYATEEFPLSRIYGSLEEFCSVNNCDAMTLGEMLTCLKVRYYLKGIQCIARR